MLKLPQHRPTPKCCLSPETGPVGRSTDALRAVLRAGPFWQGQLLSLWPDCHADPAFCLEMAAHGASYVCWGHVLNGLGLVSKVQGLVKTIDNYQLIAQARIGGRQLGQRFADVFLDVVQLFFARPLFDVLGKQGFDLRSGRLAVMGWQ